AIALAAPAQVERRHGVLLREVVELRLERGAVAAPSGDEEQLRIALPCPLVVQPQAVEFRIGHVMASSHEHPARGSSSVPGQRDEFSAGAPSEIADPRTRSLRCLPRRKARLARACWWEGVIAARLASASRMRSSMRPTATARTAAEPPDQRSSRSR